MEQEVWRKAAPLVANHGDRFKPMLPTIFRQPETLDGKAITDGTEK